MRTNIYMSFLVAVILMVIPRLSSAQPQAVDLGLSVKWASCNLGASNPEDRGDLFAWGEISTKKSFSQEEYRWYVPKTKVWKYRVSDKNTGSGKRPVDNKYRLELKDDAAHVIWGGKWRLPTKEEFTELRKECDWTWTVQNGINGFFVRSKTTGNSIFIPAHSKRQSRSDPGDWYWSSSICENDDDYAWCLFIEHLYYLDHVVYEGYVDVYNNNYINLRYVGLPIRPVCPKD